MHTRVHPFETNGPVIAHIRETNNMQSSSSDHIVIEDLPDPCPSTFQGRDEQLAIWEDIYSPILKALRLFGTYFGETSLTRISSASSHRKRRASIWLFFSCAVVATIWLTVGLLLISLSYEAFAGISTFFMTLMFLVWYLLAALKATICLFVLPITKARQSRFENFIRKLIECNAELKKLRSTSRKTITAVGLMWISATIFIITLMLLHPQLFLGSYKPWNGWHGFSITIFSSLALVLGYGVLLFFIPLFCMTCLILERLFDDFCQKAIRNLDTLDLRALKDKHRQLCGVVELASKVFSPLLSATLSLQIPFICFTFFVAVKREPSQISRGVAPEYLILFCVICVMQAAGQIAVFLTFGARVNEKIHSIQNILEGANVSDKDQVKLLAFMFYLNREPKGFSVGGLFVITKSLSLTIAGIIISYCAVMLSLPI